MKVCVLSFIALFTLAACNTVEGAGKDIKAAGSKIESTANKTKK